MDSDLQTLMIRARHTIANNIEKSGGCDHQVGICVCDDAMIVEDIDRWFIRNLTAAQYIEVTLAAAPAHNQRVQWTSRVSETIRRYGVECVKESE